MRASDFSSSLSHKSSRVEVMRGSLLFPRYLPAQRWPWLLSSDERTDVCTSVCLTLADGHTKHARANAQRQAALLQQQEGVQDAWISEQGHIHVKFQSEWLLQQCIGYYQYRIEDAMPLRWVLDYGANLASQDVNWSAARGAVIGDTLTRLLQWQGHRVESEYTFNDTSKVNERLLHAIKEGVVALQQCHAGSAPPSVVFAVPALYSYLAECARKMDVRSDSALRSFASDTMLARHKECFSHLRVWFDTVSRWSLYGIRAKDVLAELQLANAVYREHGATWFNAMMYGAENNAVLVDAQQQPTYFATLLTQHAIKLGRYNDRTITLRDTRHQNVHRLLDLGIEALMFERQAYPEWVLYGEVQERAARHGHEMPTIEDMVLRYGSNAVRCAMLGHRRHRAMKLDARQLLGGWSHLRIAYERASAAVPLVVDMHIADVDAHHPLLIHLLSLKPALRQCVDALDPYYLYQHMVRLASYIRAMPLHNLASAEATVLMLALEQLRQVFAMLGLDPAEVVEPKIEGGQTSPPSV